MFRYHKHDSHLFPSPTPYLANKLHSVNKSFYSYFQSAMSLVLLWLVFLLPFYAGVTAGEAAPNLNDPNYKISLVTSGLGAASDMAIDNDGNLFMNDYRDPGTGTGNIYWFKTNGDMQIINANLTLQPALLEKQIHLLLDLE